MASLNGNSSLHLAHYRENYQKKMEKITSLKEEVS